METTLTVPTGPERVAVLGSGDRNLKLLRDALGVSVAARGGTVHLSGDGPSLRAAERVLRHLSSAGRAGDAPSRQRVVELISRAMAGSLDDGLPEAGAGPAAREVGADRPPANGTGEPGIDVAPSAVVDSAGPGWRGDRLNVTVAGSPVGARSSNQAAYLDAIRRHDLVFAIGPAGTGKTYLAVAAAVHMLKADLIRRVVLVRPAVEAGERLGFLPGDLQEKVNPYLRPLLDALHDMLDYQTIKRFSINDIIEVAPLAYMRGRTLNHAAIILDEAQNTTRGQMQMFLTRMGHGSKVIVTGDTTQIDLPEPGESGLVDAARRLRRVKGVAFVGLEKEDIVRHPLVQRIVDAYGSNDAANSGGGAGGGRPPTDFVD